MNAVKSARQRANRSPVLLGVFLVLATVATLPLAASGRKETRLPDPPARSSEVLTGMETAVLAGGCFWGVEAVFEALDGVADVVSGYAGGDGSTADYEMVSSGRTGHAESVRIVFDPSLVSYGTLLKVFFSVAHDPTQLNYQGPDVGTQYRSAVFFANEEQRQVAEQYIQTLEKDRVYPKPVVTQVVPLQGFYPAESYHQDFMAMNPSHPYIVYWDAPKIEHLRKEFPELLKAN